MPIVLVTYAQPLSDDITQSIPCLTEEQDRRLSLMRQVFSETAPALIALPGGISEANREIRADPQAQYTCSLLAIRYAAIEQWVSPCLTEQDYHKDTFNLTLSRMMRILGHDQLGLVLCSRDVASVFLKKKVEPCEMIRFRSTIRHGSARLVFDDTVKMPCPQHDVDAPTQVVTHEEREAARKQVEAIMAAKASLDSRQPLASTHPEGVNLAQLTSGIAGHDQSRESASQSI